MSYCPGWLRIKKYIYHPNQINTMKCLLLNCFFISVEAIEITLIINFILSSSHYIAANAYLSYLYVLDSHLYMNELYMNVKGTIANITFFGSSHWELFLPSCLVAPNIPKYNKEQLKCWSKILKKYQWKSLFLERLQDSGFWCCNFSF